METKKKIFFGILLVIWLCVIFFFSSQPGEVSLKQSDTIIYKITDVVSKKDEETKKDISLKWTFLVRKTAHFLEYFILGLIIYLVLDTRGIKYIIISSVILTILFASLDEIHQIFVVGRTPKIFDICIDTLGSCTAIMCASFIKKNK